jgi:hypothetical protein
MFYNDIGSWVVARVLEINEMFALSISFNQDTGSWNVANVKS